MNLKLVFLTTALCVTVTNGVVQKRSFTDAADEIKENKGNYDRF